MSTDSQDQLLEQEDGRYFAIDKVGTGLGAIATGERLDDTIVHFGLPSGPALWLNIAKRAFDEVKNVDPMTYFDHHAEGWWPDSQTSLFNFFERFSSHVIFAHTAIEAFANEVINNFIPDPFIYTLQKKDGQPEQLSKSDIERRIELDQKLHSVLPQGLSLASPRGTAVWQHYQEIKKMRNRVIHLKAVDRNRSGPEEESLWGDMLRSYSVPYCDYAYAIIGHYKPATENRRWFQRYPYDPS